MDIKEYINSGVVELYAMNALSPIEKAEFEQKVLLYSELKKDLLRVQQHLETYSEAHTSNPRPELRIKILSAIDNTKKQKSKEKISSTKENSYLTYKYLIAACLAALVVSTFASLFFFSRWNEAEDRYSILLKDKNQLSLNYNLVKNEFDKNVSDLIVIRDLDSKVIQLLPTDTSALFGVRVYWNPKAHLTYINVLSLPVPMEGKQYQLWSIAGGNYFDAGVFDFSNFSIQRIKDVYQADSWIITIEPIGGSFTPTLDQVLLVGKKC